MDNSVKVIFAIIASIVILMIGMFLRLACDEVTADRYSIRKDAFTCTKQHSEPTTTYVQSGKVRVPISGTYKVCDQYTRKGQE